MHLNQIIILYFIIKYDNLNDIWLSMKLQNFVVRDF